MDTTTPAREKLSDEQLMQRVARDDTQAFDTLLLRHQAAVYHFLGRLLNDAAEAEDLTQECFLRVWRARGSYLPTAMFRTWLFTIARRLALDAAKRREVQTVPLPDDRDRAGNRSHARRGSVADPAADPQQVVLARELASLLDRALQHLPDELRETMILRDVEHLTYEQIAEILGCPLGTVKSRLNAARSQIRTAARQWYETR